MLLIINVAVHIFFMAMMAPKKIHVEVDPDVINESLADVDGGGEEIDVDLLKQVNLVEPDKDECILSDNDIKSDFDDTYTALVIHTLKLIACLMFIVCVCVCIFTFV